MLSFFKSERAALQAYGKLPLAKDYLRVGAGTGEGRALRDWLDAGFSGQAGGEAAPSFAWPARFLWNGAGGEPLVGCAWPSSDAGGHRRFPFVVFVERRRRSLAGRVAGRGVAGAASLWRQLEAVWQARENFADGQALVEALRGRELELDAPGGGAEVGGVQLDDWLDALWPDAGLDGFVGALHDLDLLARAGHRGPLRVPLAGGLACAPQVDAWWRALVALGLARARELVTCFLPQETLGAQDVLFATFFLAPPAPRDARWLTTPPPDGPLAGGDLVPPVPRRAERPRPASEGTPPLSDSVRGALVRLRSRAR